MRTVDKQGSESAAVVLVAQRLMLRRMVAEDLESLFAIWGDAETMVHYPRPYSRAEVAELIERQQRRYREEGHGLWAVVLKGSWKVLGDCGLVSQEVEGKREIEVGYHFHRDCWGHGYATEAAEAAVKYGFSVLKYERIIALVRPENLASRRVAERLGMKVAKQVMWRELPHDMFAASSEEFKSRP